MTQKGVLAIALIDPFTIVAQIVNFAILVFALKHFLYNRVIGAMDAREASIGARLRDADQRAAEAADEADRFRQRRKALDDQAQALVTEARASADRHRRRLLDDARADVDDERRRWQQALRAERSEFEHELRQRTAEEVIELARRVLGDLSGIGLEAAVVSKALDHLGAAGEARTELVGDQPATTPIVVRTAFALPNDSRNEILDRLRLLGLEPRRPVRFEVDASLLLGVEFQSGAAAVCWHADDHLNRLAATVRTLIDREDHRADD